MADEAPTLHNLVGTETIKARKLTAEATEAAQRGARLMERAAGTIYRRKYTHKPGRNWSPGYGENPWHWGDHGKAQLFPSEDGTRYVVTVQARDGKVQTFQGEYATLDAALRNGTRAASNPDQATWAAGWNEKFPKDTPVLYWTGERVGDGTLGRTRGPASVLGGRAAVMVTGHGAWVGLTHVQPITEGEAVYWQRREESRAG